MSTSKNTACLVVIYNKNCTESLTCQTLKKICATKVIILDNSTEDFDNETFCRNAGWIYINNNGNIGLSKAYNKGIDYLKSIGFKGYICLFDDDSEFDETYFDVLQKRITDNSEANILLPIIYSDNTIISPCLINSDMQTSVFDSYADALTYTGNDISGINSAMAIASTVFENYRYDENIFLDGIDHKFIFDMKKEGHSISVMDYKMHQNFSGNEKTSLKSALNRFGIYAKDMRYIMSDNLTAYKKLIIKRLLKLTLTYKSFAFIKRYSEISKNK